MKITQEILQTSYNVFDSKTKFFTLLIFMHKYGVINDDRLIALFNNARKNPEARKGTYKCTINDKWYHDEKFIDILYDAWIKHPNYPGSRGEIEMEELINYVNRFINKPRNYCIDWIRSHYLESVVDNIRKWNINELVKITDSFGIKSSVYVSEYFFEPSGHCCEDCDGPWEDYKASRYEYDVIRPTIEDLKVISVKHLDTFKKKYPVYEASKLK